MFDPFKKPEDVKDSFQITTIMTLARLLKVKPEEFAQALIEDGKNTLYFAKVTLEAIKIKKKLPNSPENTELEDMMKQLKKEVGDN